jgi:ankyrin repeat protein
VAVLERLTKAGARLNADPYRGTPLIWAAVRNRVETAEWLLDHGANVNQKATFGGATHGQGITALHMAAQNGSMAVVKLLVARGADLTLKEDLSQSTAAGAAEYFGQIAVRDFLLLCEKQAAPHFTG